jgi:hypothetical protein
MLRGEGIELLVDLIIGLPGDTAQDVSRGIDFLLEHGLGESAQVFPLCVLPGTAMRAGAGDDGIVFDPAPPYRVLGTRTMSKHELREALFAAEERLGRRLDEYARPHLVEAHGQQAPPDVFEVNVDCDSPGSSAQPGAQHVALWLRGADLFRARAAIRRAVEARLAVDPHATLDVVLCPQHPFPLNLLDDLRNQLDAATPSYSARTLAHRGENLQRRIVVVLPADAQMPEDYVEALLDNVAVYRDQTVEQAVRNARSLGVSQPGARIIDTNIDKRSWRALRDQADAESVAFAVREHERAWQQRVLQYSDIGEKEVGPVPADVRYESS